MCRLHECHHPAVSAENNGNPMPMVVPSPNWKLRNDTCAGLTGIAHRWRCSWNHRTAVMAVQRGTPEPARTLPETPPRLRCAWRLSFGSFASRMPFPLTRTHGCHPVSIVSQPAPLNPSCPRILRDRLHFNGIVGCSTPPAPLSHSDLHFLPFPLAKGRK